MLFCVVLRSSVLFSRVQLFFDGFVDQICDVLSFGLFVFQGSDEDFFDDLAYELLCDGVLERTLEVDKGQLISEMVLKIKLHHFPRNFKQLL